MFIGDQIRAARERHGMTQKQLADAVGVAEGTVTLWENRKNNRPISAQHLHKVAEILGAPELAGEPATAKEQLARMIPLSVTSAEKAMIMLFRTFTEELQLLQLSQFVECANLGKAEYLMRQDTSSGASVGAGDSHPS